MSKTFAEWFGEDLTGQTYEGDIKCASKQLTSLEGAPKIVNGDFWCNHNQLTSLEGAPQEVKGYFFCSHNQLASLEGGPQKVGSFDCSYNSLTSLEGRPQEVGYSFNCSDNQLTSLKGAPQEVSGSFDCSYNSLTSLEGGPKEVGVNFNCSGNQLTSLKGAPQKVGNYFDCSNNKLTSLDGIGKVKGEIYSDLDEKSDSNLDNGSETLMFSFDDLPKEVEEFLYDESNYSIAPEIQEFIENNGDKQFEEWEVPDLMEQIRDFALSLAEKDLMDSDIYEEISDAIDKFLEDNADYFNESRAFTTESKLLRKVEKLLDETN